MSDDGVTPPNARAARETERVLRFYEKEARKYDREMRIFERLLFAGGREWVCSQAAGKVLEIARARAATPTCASATPRRSTFPTSVSTP